MIHPEASVDECMLEISALEAEVERLKSLAEVFSEERDRAWTAHLIERENLKAEKNALQGEIERLRALNDQLQKELTLALAEVDRLRLSRKKVKEAIENLLERYGTIVADTPPVTPHHGLGRGGLKGVK